MERIVYKTSKQLVRQARAEMATELAILMADTIDRIGKTGKAQHLLVPLRPFTRLLNRYKKLMKKGK